MTYNAFKYCLLQIFGLAVVAVIPSLFIGVLKWAAEMTLGHSATVSLGPGIAFFLVAYLSIIVIGSTWAIAALRKKAKAVGITFDHLGSLSSLERREFEKQHNL